MIIHKLHLSSYGKFKDKTICFEDGLNYIFGANESGKSTVMSFIKAMLYGFTGRGADGDRKRYIPWDGSVLSGEMEVTLPCGKRVIISRTSGKTPAQDQCIISDAHTGEKLNIDLAEEIGIGENAFLKTVSIRQNESEIRGGDEELTDKLLNLAGGGSEDAGYDDAVLFIKDKIRELKHLRGDGGKINELARRITELNEEIEKEKIQNQKLLAFFSEEKQLHHEIACLETEVEDIEKRLYLAQNGEKRKAYEVTRKKAEALLEAKTEAENRLEEITNKLISLSEFKTEIDESVYETLGDAAPYEAELKDRTIKKSISLVIGTLFLASGVVFLLLSMYLVGFLSLAFGIFGFVSISLQLNRIKNTKSKLYDIEFKKSNQKTLLHAYGCETVKEYTERRSEYITLEEKKHACHEKINYIQVELENLSKDENAPEGQFETDFSDEDPALVETEKNMKINSLFERKQRLAAVEGFLKGKQKSGKTLDILLTELEDAEEKLVDAEKDLEALKLAQDTLDSIYAELSRDFSPRISEKASHYLSIITGKDENLLLDKSFSVTMGRDAHRALKFYSGGTIDQAFLAVRLAVSELIQEGRSIPFFLDDSFVQYDEFRENNTLSLLKEIAKNRQVFWFSCKERKTEDVNRITL